MKFETFYSQNQIQTKSIKDKKKSVMKYLEIKTTKLRLGSCSDVETNNTHRFKL